MAQQPELKENSVVSKGKIYPPSKSKTRPGMSFLALLCALLALAGVVYFYWNNSTTVGNLFTSTESVQRETRSSLQQVRDEVAGVQSQANRQEAVLTEIQQMSGGDLATWRFAEAKYLVQLASYHLTFTRDVPAALALLQTAEQRIATLNDPTLLPLRQMIANNIVALEAVPKLDLVGLLTRITALQMQVNKLPSIGLPALNTPQEEPGEPLSPLNKAIHDSWATLQKIVIIRRTDQPIQPLLSPEQQAYLQQNLQLILQQAQWAVLRGQQDVYQNSLQQAEKWVRRYFAQNIASTQAFLTALAALQKIDVQPPLPDLAPLAKKMQQTTFAPMAEKLNKKGE